jgi:hypothetical protein
MDVGPPAVWEDIRRSRDQKLLLDCFSGRNTSQATLQQDATFEKADLVLLNAPNGQSILLSAQRVIRRSEASEIHPRMVEAKRPAAHSRRSEGIHSRPRVTVVKHL